MPRIIVSLDGGIGSGKSCLLERVQVVLQSHAALGDMPVHIIQEPVERWMAPVVPRTGLSMLQAYYNDARTNAFAFQMFVLATRVDQLLQLPADCLVLSERCLRTHDDIFARMSRDRGHIDNVQWTTYRSWVDTVSKMTGEAGSPDAVVYLKTSPEVCMRRIATRDRDAEHSMTAADIRELHDAHEAYIDALARNGTPILVLDGDIDTTTASPLHVERVAVQVADFVLMMRTDARRQ